VAERVRSRLRHQGPLLFLAGPAAIHPSAAHLDTSDERPVGFCSARGGHALGTPLAVAIYRKKVAHRTAKNFQLDLFDPNDGYYEYSGIPSNLGFTVANLWYFMAGRGNHERTIGQLKSGLAVHTIPTMAYAANSAWQQLVVLTHNLLTNFQIETGAHRRRRSRKHTALPLLQTVQTLRFTLFLPGHSFIAPRHWYAPGAGQYCDSRATPPRSAWSPASNRVCRAPHEFFVRSRFS